MKRKLLHTTRFYFSLALLTNLIWFALAAANQSAEARNLNITNSIENEPNQKPQSFAPKKRALLVGVSEYCRQPNSSECSPGYLRGKYWWNLNTKPDVETLAEILKNDYKFDEVTILQTRDETTHKAIVDAFRQRLIAPTSNGDIVYFHFSGHGQQVPDDGDAGDVEPDGFDESIIPSDYVSRQDPKNNIRDDEIAKLLSELKTKAPGNVTVTFDSCFSGTATRGELLPRGESWHGEMPKTAGRGLDDTGTGLARGQIQPGYVFISAASPTQVALEDYDKRIDENGRKISVPMGLFTLALSRALKQATDKTSYRDLFYQINAYVTARQYGQNPQIEGKLDTAVLNGSALPVEPFVLLMPGANGGAILQAGSLQGMTEGSKFEICPAGTKSRAECKTSKLADAVIERVFQRQSIIKIKDNKPLVISREKPLRAFESERAIDFSALKVVVQNLEQLQGGKEAVAAIRQFGLAEMAINRGEKTYDVLVRPAAGDDKKNNFVKPDFRGAVMQRRDGTIFAAIPDGAELGREIRLRLENEMRWKTVVEMNNNNPDLKVEMRVFRAEGEVIDGEFVETEESKKKIEAAKRNEILRGEQQFEVGDFIRLEVTNQNPMPIYVTVLNLTPDGKVAPAFPNPNKCLTPCNNFIAAGKPLPLYFRLTEPVGTEGFKVLATLEQMDFSPLITPELLDQRGGVENLSGGQRGGAQHPLGLILQALNDANDKQIKARAASASTQPQSWATATVTYVIKQKSGAPNK